MLETCHRCLHKGGMFCLLACQSVTVHLSVCPSVCLSVRMVAHTLAVLMAAALLWYHEPLLCSQSACSADLLPGLYPNALHKEQGHSVLAHALSCKTAAI